LFSTIKLRDSFAAFSCVTSDNSLGWDADDDDDDGDDDTPPGGFTGGFTDLEACKEG